MSTETQEPAESDHTTQLKIAVVEDRNDRLSRARWKYLESYSAAKVAIQISPFRSGSSLESIDRLLELGHSLNGQARLFQSQPHHTVFELHGDMQQLKSLLVLLGFQVQDCNYPLEWYQKQLAAKDDTAKESEVAS